MRAVGPADQTAAPATRAVEHLAGVTQVPVAPERVVALDDVVAMALVALGLVPAGAMDIIEEFLGDVQEVLPPGLDTTGIEVVAVNDEPSLERVAAVSPDLIIGTDNTRELHDELSVIAPSVVLLRGFNGDWRERFLRVAEVVNRTEEAAEVDAEYQRLLDGLPEALRRTEVAFVRPGADGQFLIDSLPTGFAGSVAEDAGIPPTSVPEGVGELAGGGAGGFVIVSGERLDLISGAGLIVVPDFRSVGAEQDSLTQFAANPLWARLPAVQAGRVLQVPGLVYNGGNHFAATSLLNAIVRALS